MLAPFLGIVLLAHIAVLPVLVLLRAFGVQIGPAWRYYEALAGGIDAISRNVGMAAAWLTLVMVGVEFAIVVMSYVFSIGYIWMQESVVYMHAALFLLAASYTLLEEGHVRVDVFFREASIFQRALTDFLGAYFLLLPVMALTAWKAYPYVERSWMFFEGSKETSGIQAVYMLKTLIIIFAAMMIMQGFASAIRAAHNIFAPSSSAKAGPHAIGPEV